MTQQLLTICYVSTAVQALSQAEIDELLSQSQHRNAAAGVTGLLLYCDGNFMQYIEGEPERLQPVWESIQRDPRHSGVSAVFQNMTTERLFGAWSMAYSSSMPPELAALLRRAQGSQSQSQWADTIARLLLSFWQQSWSREFHGHTT